MKKIIALFAAFLAVTASTTYAEDITASASTTFASKYIWRGFNLTDGASIQPGVRIGAAGAYVGYWGAYNWDNKDTIGEAGYSEHDLYLGYDWNSDPMTFSVGFTHYEFPVPSSYESEEFWFTAKLNDEMFLNPSLTIFFDIGKESKGGGDGQYYLFSVGHSIKIQDGLDLNLGAGLGYNSELFITEKGLADLTPSAELVTKVTDHMSISLKATYSTIINNDVEDAMGADNEFAGLLTVNIA